MKNINFKSLEEVIGCYGRDNIIAIDCIKQVIFYTKYGCQPKFICENEVKQGKITCWFLKSETTYVYQRWLENRPSKD